MNNDKYELHSLPSKSGNNSEFGPQPHKSTEITQKPREYMIAEAAYYIAEHRNFQGGDPAQDWLQAQMEIDSIEPMSPT